MKQFTIIISTLCIIAIASIVIFTPVEQAGRPAITAVAHAGFFTKDFDGTRALFKEYFGFEEPIVMPNYEEGGYRFTFIKVNEYQYVEIFPERNPADERMYHHAIVTEDADAMRLYLKSIGHDELPDTTPKGRTGNSNYFVSDPNGTICEVVQYEPDSMTAATDGLFLPEERISSKLSHVGFGCPDLDKALAFYVGELGFEEVWRGRSAFFDCELVHLKVPEGGECIELIVYSGEPSWEELCAMQHICFEVDDLESTQALLSQRTLPEGCRGDGQIVVGGDNIRQMNFFNVDGTRIKLIEKK